MATRLPIVLVVHEDMQLARQISKMASELAEVIHKREMAQVAILLKTNSSLSAAIVGNPAGRASPLEVMSAIKNSCPRARRVLLVDPGDLSVSIAALHDGIADHILTKPLRERDIVAMISAIVTPRNLPAAIIEQASLESARTAG